MLPNGTFISGQMAHTGQFFVPDDINVRVDKVRNSPFAECTKLTLAS
jgi:hypothetical protein